jgi:hypothetical protein
VSLPKDNLHIKLSPGFGQNAGREVCGSCPPSPPRDDPFPGESTSPKAPENAGTLGNTLGNLSPTKLPAVFSILDRDNRHYVKSLTLIRHLDSFRTSYKMEVVPKITAQVVCELAAKLLAISFFVKRISGKLPR